MAQSPEPSRLSRSGKERHRGRSAVWEGTRLGGNTVREGTPSGKDHVLKGDPSRREQQTPSRQGTKSAESVKNAHCGEGAERPTYQPGDTPGSGSDSTLRRFERVRNAGSRFGEYYGQRTNLSPVVMFRRAGRFRLRSALCPSNRDKRAKPRKRPPSIQHQWLEPP